MNRPATVPTHRDPELARLEGVIIRLTSLDQLCSGDDHTRHGGAPRAAVLVTPGGRLVVPPSMSFAYDDAARVGVLA